MDEVIKNIRREYLEEKASVWEVERVAIDAKDSEYREMARQRIKRSCERVFEADFGKEEEISSRPEYLVELVKKIQRGFATVDASGDVYSLEEPEIGAEAHYLGKLPRKMIPGRRKLERMHKRARVLEENLESLEKGGKKVTRVSEASLVAGGCPTNAVGVAMFQLKYRKLP